MDDKQVAFVKADKDLFSVYQTIYSNADLEMWYDWNLRLQDTKWTENCFWVTLNGIRIGGAIIEEQCIIWPFLICPFTDRTLFWKLILRHMTAKNNEPVNLIGMPDSDMDVLLSFGCRIVSMRRMMCRPTDRFDVIIPEGYERRIPGMDDIPALVEADRQGYAGGIVRELFGEPNDVEDGLTEALRMYESTGTTGQFSIVFSKETKEIAGFCQVGAMAYHRDDALDDFSSIGSITVLPAHRNRGLAEYMIKYALNEAYKTSKVMRLGVTVGNQAEYLYRKLGFVPGPRFTNMKYKA
jgi:ribosomal protein S18 acetylase RimI-like enzyme